MPCKWVGLFLLAGPALLPAQTSTEFFETRIRPLLAEKCYACHTASKLGDLRVDSREALLQGGKSGPAMVPGKAGESLLFRAVLQNDARLKMPMAGGKLSATEIAALREWIDGGAVWPASAAQTARPAQTGFAITPEQRAFWSLRPLKRSGTPAVRNVAWARSPIDRFLLARLEEKNLQPAPAADKRVLLRRAYYDLIGLPPTPEQVEEFAADSSPGAFAKVVDRLLESNHYGERWGRHWLDVARYADGGGKDKRPVFLGYGMARDGYVNTWRYRDWVVNAFNSDMPYDRFVKAQIAADLMPESEREALLPGLGFFGLGPWFTGDDVVFVEARANERDDKIDALTKGFLGLTVTCARCHDHKYDPISQKDYYALGGVFWSSGYYEYNLAPASKVDSYKAHWKKVKDLQSAIEAHVGDLTTSVAQDLAGQTARYMMAARRVLSAAADPKSLARDEKLDELTLERWVKYLGRPSDRQHPYLTAWDAAMKGSGDAAALKEAARFQELVLAVIAAKKTVLKENEDRVKTYLPDPNEATVELPGDLRQFEFFQYKQLLVQKVMETHKHYVWLDVVQGEASPDYPKREAIFENPGKQLLRFLTAAQKSKLDSMQAELAALEKASPPEYPYLMGLAENSRPANLKLALRGNVHALGDEVPRGLPAILAREGSDPKPFAQGSGRLELAEAIVNHPLTARVIANRIWLQHFGRGIVNTPSNFGVTGERPSHPELLDYLASRLVENNWSIKSLHREIMLSSAYQLSALPVAANMEADPGNVLLWRANVRRLEAEAIRDSLLFVSGTLDERLGGTPRDLNDAANKKRTVYARVRRTGGEGILGLFDFPDPAVSGDQRAVTNVPLQGLFFLNSDLIWREAGRLCERLKTAASDDPARIQNAYRLLFGRPATGAEVRRGLAFLETEKDGWQQYAQVLLSSGEFLYLN